MRVTIIVPITAAAGAAANNRKNITIKYCASFTNCISEKNNIQIDNAKDIDIVMPMNNLTEYSDNYSKTSGIFGITTEISHFYMLMVLLLIFLLIIIRVLRLNLKQK